MKKYCRYCSYAFIAEENCIYCEVKKDLINNQKAKLINKCKDFNFNEIDVFDIKNIYKPRSEYKHVKKTYEQLTLFELAKARKENDK